MSNEISISIKATDPAQLTRMLAELAAQLNPSAIRNVAAQDDMTQAQVNVETGEQKRGRGRPRKEQEAPAAAATEPFLAGGLAGHDGAGMELAGATGAGNGSGSAADARGTDAVPAGASGHSAHGVGAAPSSAGANGPAGPAGPSASVAGNDGTTAANPNGAADADSKGAVSETAPSVGSVQAGAAGAGSAGQVNVVGDLTPEKAREQAIAALQVHFGKNPNNMSEITRLQTKYGVKMFKEVTDARALEFLADVKLVAAGSPVAA